LNNYKDWSRHEFFSQTSVPPETPFFVRLDGWKFRKLSEILKTEKPFDEKFAKCLVSAGKILFKRGFSPALIYVASDEINILFLNNAPFQGRVEKIDSILSGLISSTFTLNLKKFFKESPVTAFDSRIIIAPNTEKIVDYLAWRQMNAWRNHNNAYAYWVFRKIGHKPSEIAKKLKGLKTEELHEVVFNQGVNLAKTPPWQRRGILAYKQPFLKKAENYYVKRWRIRENWNLPLFTSEDGVKLIQQIIEWMKEKRKSSVKAAENPKN
jgi:tRNA(His) 5'-end guanylyltransferase